MRLPNLSPFDKLNTKSESPWPHSVPEPKNHSRSVDPEHGDRADNHPGHGIDGPTHQNTSAK
jgi:hypothetical protein